MTSQPFYHLRPNKYIDRFLFMQVLNGLSKQLPISEYYYIGFGSYYFDDFKLAHNQLGINNMISLEIDNATYKRAKFNKPYRCIDIINQSSTDFISSHDFDAHPSIIWLDYTAPAGIGAQFNDYCSALTSLRDNDIVRITLNAHAASIGFDKELMSSQEKQIKRHDLLKSRIGDFLPIEVKPHDVTSRKYPLVLMQCLEKATMDTLVETSYQTRFFLPIFSSIYGDGQTMMTLTGIILNNRDGVERIKSSLSNMDFCTFNWADSCYIQIPPLTNRELIEVNRRIPYIEDNAESFSKRFNFIFENADSLKSYVRFYKSYPNFHHVNC